MHIILSTRVNTDDIPFELWQAFRIWISLGYSMEVPWIQDIFSFLKIELFSKLNGGRHAYASCITSMAVPHCIT